MIALMMNMMMPTSIMRMCVMLSIMMMLLIIRLMMMLMMTLSVLGCSANGLEANQSGTHKAQCANKLLSTHLPGELGNSTPSSLPPPFPPLRHLLLQTQSLAQTKSKAHHYGSLAKQFLCVTCITSPFPFTLLPHPPSISLLVLVILNAANLHISRLGALVHNAKSLADRTLPGH